MKLIKLLTLLLVISHAANAVVFVRGTGEGINTDWPLDYGTPYLWYDFGDETTLFTDSSRTTAVTTTGQEVLGITDLSGSGNHGTSVATDAFAWHSTNTAVEDLSGRDAYISFTHTASARTVIVVFKQTASAANNGFLVGDSALYDYHPGGSGELISSTYGATEVKNGRTNLDGSIVEETTEVLSDTTSYHVVSYVTTGNTDIRYISKDRASTDRGLQGQLAEVVIYESALSTADQDAAVSDAMTKWGL